MSTAEPELTPFVRTFVRSLAELYGADHAKPEAPPTRPDSLRTSPYELSGILAELPYDEWEAVVSEEQPFYAYNGMVAFITNNPDLGLGYLSVVAKSGDCSPSTWATIARFIAAARNEVPALLRENTELKRRLAQREHDLEMAILNREFDEAIVSDEWP